MMVITSWCIAIKRSFFISIFSLPLLIMFALFNPLIPVEPLHVWSVVGAIFIFIGLYLIIRGKKDDKNKPVEEPQELEADEQPPPQEVQAQQPPQEVLAQPTPPPSSAQPVVPLASAIVTAY